MVDARSQVDLGALLREVDRLTPRPPGATVSIAKLEALARRRRTRRGITLLVALLLPAAVVTSLSATRHQVPPQPTHITATTRWLHQLREQRAQVRMRELTSAQRSERAVARTAAVVAVYGETLLARGDVRGNTLLQDVATDFAGTSGGQRAARALASVRTQDHR